MFQSFLLLKTISVLGCHGSETGATEGPRAVGQPEQRRAGEPGAA